MRLRILAVAGLLLVAGTPFALGGPGTSAAPGPAASTAAAGGPAASDQGPLDSATSVVALFTPGGTTPFHIVADGGPLTIVVRLNNGASLGGVLHGPAPCGDDAFSTNVIALSTSGQALAWVECDAVAGPLVFTVDSGQSAFAGTVELEGATFQAA